MTNLKKLFYVLLVTFFLVIALVIPNNSAQAISRCGDTAGPYMKADVYDNDTGEYLGQIVAEDSDNDGVSYNAGTTNEITIGHRIRFDIMALVGDASSMGVVTYTGGSQQWLEGPWGIVHSIISSVINDSGGNLDWFIDQNCQSGEDTRDQWGELYISVPARTESTGNIRVTSNVYTGWTISGPETFRGDGTTYTHVAKPAGMYTIYPDGQGGYNTPPSQTLSLSNGGEITFNLVYTLTPVICSGCSAPEPSCRQVTYGTDSCGNQCTRVGGQCPPPTCTGCNAPEPACERTEYGVDSCGNQCTRTGGECPRGYCGDGIINQSSEQCDDGGNNGSCPNSRCSTSCTLNNCPGVVSVTTTVAKASDGVYASSLNLPASDAGASLRVRWVVSNATNCQAYGTGWAERSLSAQSSSDPATAPGVSQTYTYGVSCTGQGNSSALSAATVSIGAPPCVPHYGQACTGPTSPPNSCGDTNPGGAGTYSCEGYCSGAAGQTPAERSGYGQACASAANSCGQTNSGVYVCSGSGVACNASTPPDSSCPAPTMSISSSPSAIGYGGSSVISWSSTNASSCSVSAGWTGTSGSQSTGALTSSQTYSATCVGYNGTSVSGSTSVSVAPVCSPDSQFVGKSRDSAVLSAVGGNGSYSWTGGGTPATGSGASFSTVYSTVGTKTVSVASSGQSDSCSVVVKNLPCTDGCDGNPSGPGTSDDIGVATPSTDTPGVAGNSNSYCGSGPWAQLYWTYSGDSAQKYYAIQITDNGSFVNPIVNITKTANAVPVASGNRFDAPVINLGFNRTYQARFMVWDSDGIASNWISMPASWTTPKHAWPQISSFVSDKSKPAKNTPVIFTTINSFFDSVGVSNRGYLVSFGDGQTATGTVAGSPLNVAHTYSTEGTYPVSVKLTDIDDGYACTTNLNIGSVQVQKPIPEWKEVAPR